MNVARFNGFQLDDCGRDVNNPSYPRRNLLADGSPSLLGLEIMQAYLCHLEQGHWRNTDFRMPFWRFYLNLDSGIRLLRDGYSFDLAPGQACLIAPETSYGARCTADVRHVYVHFLLGVPYADARPGIYCLPAARDWSADVQHIVESLEGEENRSWQSYLAMASLLTAALSELPGDCFTLPAAEPRISAVSDYVRRHLRQRITNDDLARCANMQVTAFARFFKHRTGISPHQFVVRERLTRACTLLHDASLSIEAIADEVGLCDRSHFTNLFHSHHNMTPVEFRRRIFSL